MRQRQAAGPDVRLYVLDTGLIECSDYAIFSPNAGPGVRQDMSVRSYLIVHPQGTLLWDTGIADAIAELPDGQRIIDSIVFKVPKTLRSQLSEIGVDPRNVDYLGLSHLHIDHVGNVDLLPDATVLLQKDEYAAGYGPQPGGAHPDPRDICRARPRPNPDRRRRSRRLRRRDRRAEITARAHAWASGPARQYAR